MSARKIVMRVVSISFSILVIILVVFALTKLGSYAYQFGYRVFTEQPVDSGEGRDVVVRLDAGLDGREVGEMLESKGLIERIPGTDNKKHIEIVLLEKAEPIIENGIKVQREFAKHVLTGLSEEEMRTCKAVFNKICRNADEYLKKHAE